jgi:hypothetical protein
MRDTQKWRLATLMASEKRKKMLGVAIPMANRDGQEEARRRILEIQRAIEKQSSRWGLIAAIG